MKFSWQPCLHFTWEQISCLSTGGEGGCSLPLGRKTLVLSSCQEVSSAMSYKQRRILAVWITNNNSDLSCISLLQLPPTILSGRLFHLLSLALVITQGLLLKQTWAGVSSLERRHSLQESSLPSSHASGSHRSSPSWIPSQPVHSYIVRGFSAIHIHKGWEEWFHICCWVWYF